MNNVFAFIYAFAFNKNQEIQNEIFKKNKVNEKADEFHNTFILTFKLNMKLTNHKNVFANVKSTI